MAFEDFKSTVLNTISDIADTVMAFLNQNENLQLVYIILCLTILVFLIFWIYLKSSQKKLVNEFNKQFEDQTPIYKRKIINLRGRRNSIRSAELKDRFSDLTREYLKHCLEVQGEYTFEELAKMIKKKKFIKFSEKMSDTLYSEKSSEKDKIVEIMDEFIQMLEKEEQNFVKRQQKIKLKKGIKPKIVQKKTFSQPKAEKSKLVMPSFNEKESAEKETKPLVKKIIKPKYSLGECNQKIIEIKKQMRHYLIQIEKEVQKNPAKSEKTTKKYNKKIQDLEKQMKAVLIEKQKILSQSKSRQ